MGVHIGPCRIADAAGTHEPGEDVDNPSQALLDLAEARTVDPETGELYVQILKSSKPAPEPTPEPEPEPAPSNPTPDPTPAPAATAAPEPDPKEKP